MPARPGRALYETPPGNVNRIPARAAATAGGGDLRYSRGVQFEVEVYQNERGEWVATAVGHDVVGTGTTENEALARVMEALAAHFKTSDRR